MDTTFIMKSEHATPGVPVRILERTKDGLLLGEYVGYYNFKRDTFTLYPCYNPFAINTGKLRKQTVAARLVRYP